MCNPGNDRKVMNVEISSLLIVQSFIMQFFVSLFIQELLDEVSITTGQE